MVLREARRFFRSSPLLSVSGVVILALGIGSSALAVTLLLVFSSLTYPGMRSLGYATIAELTEGGGSIEISWNRLEKLHESVSQNTKFAAYSKPITTTLKLHDVSRILNVAAVSSGFFSIFTDQLIAGRDISRGEESQVGRHVTILSLTLARDLFQTPENALGRFVVIDELPFEVIGVAPPGFHGLFGNSVEAWVPANCVIPLDLKLPKVGHPDAEVWKELTVFYGLAASKQVSSTALATGLSHSLPLRASAAAPAHVSQGLTTDPARDAQLRKRLRLGLLLAMVFTIVSSLNYALLLLARMPRYADEVRLKKALGASRVRLIAELVMGPAAMVGAGLFSAGLILAGGVIAISRISGFYGEVLRGSWHETFLAFAVQMVLACGITFVVALVPALGLLRDDGAPRMGHTSTATRREGLLLQGTVTLQIAFCIGICVLAGMIVSSLVSLMNEPLGYELSHLTVVALGPGPGGVTFSMGPGQSFPAAAAVNSLLEQVTALPGVRSATLASVAPFEGMDTVTIQPIDNASTTSRTVYQMMLIPGYFRTMETRMVRGRDLSSRTLTGHVDEIVLNRSLAKELWQNQDPLNRSVRLTEAAYAGLPSFSYIATVVGIVEDMRMAGYAGSPEPTVFMPLKGGDGSPRIIVNGSESIHSLDSLVSRQVPGLMPGLLVQSTYSVADQARASLWPEKKRAFFALIGASLMALVACIGLFGVLAYYVGTKRRELAVRICFGASSWTIRKIVIMRAVWCAMAAVILSTPLWFILARLSSSDYLGPVSWSTGRAFLISLACVLVSVLVSLIPAAAAATVSPSEILKER